MCARRQLQGRLNCSSSHHILRLRRAGMTRSYLSSNTAFHIVFHAGTSQKKRKRTQNSFNDHYTLPCAFTVFLSCVLEFFNNSDKDLLCSQEGICTMLMKNEQLARNQEKMSQVAPAHELDVRTGRPWAHSSYGTTPNATLHCNTSLSTFHLQLLRGIGFIHRRAPTSPHRPARRGSPLTPLQSVRDLARRSQSEVIPEVITKTAEQIIQEIKLPLCMP